MDVSSEAVSKLKGRGCPVCRYLLCLWHCFPDSSVGKEPSFNAGDTGDAGLIPGFRRSLEQEMATHSSILPWTEEPGGLESKGLERI